MTRSHNNKHRKHGARQKTRRRSATLPQGVLKVVGSGHGFVQTAEGEFFIPASKMHGAFDGDVVQMARIAPIDRSGAGHDRIRNQRPPARVTAVLERAHEDIVGRYEIEEPFGIVIPDDPRINHDIFTLRRQAPHVREGDIVRVHVTSYPNGRQPAQGDVVEVLGNARDQGMDIDLIVARHKLPTEFPQAVLDEVAAATVDVEGALSSGRYRDLRRRVLFTIDPEDARDFDDSISWDRVEGSTDVAGAVWRLGVHIADVSHYVPWRSATDVEAAKRSTSVYLADRVVPMLPEKLSCDVCSLKAGEDRRAMCVDIYYDDAFHQVGVDIYPAVIRSCARLAYGQVQTALDALSQGDRAAAVAALSDGILDDGVADAAERVADRLPGLHRLASALEAQRHERGGMDFDNPEPHVVLDQNGAPTSVTLRVKTAATSLVEQAMIAANEAVALFLLNCHIPSIYRVHEAPDPLGLADLKPIMQEFGYDKEVSMDRFAAGNPHAIQQVLACAEGKPEEQLVNMLVLRSMKRAVYSEECADHFGLASAAYTHFTSPIRRYPDLVVHRAVKVALFGRTGTTSAEEHALPEIADHASKMEREAEDAARESQEVKLYEMLEQHVGEEFDGIVSGVVTAGFFVRLDTTVEGFVALRDADQYYALDARRRMLVGSDNGKTYRLGSGVRIRVVDVFPMERRADFEVVARIHDRRTKRKG